MNGVRVLLSSNLGQKSYRFLASSKTGKILAIAASKQLGIRRNPLDTIETKKSLKKRVLAFVASVAVLAGGVVAGVQADTASNGKVQVTKVDDSGALLAGAHLQILDAAGDVVVDWTTTGKVDEFSVPAGVNYRLHEVAAPDGYELAADWTFNVVPSESTGTKVIQPATQLPTSVSVKNEGLPFDGPYTMNGNTPIFCADAKYPYPPTGAYRAQELGNVNGLTRDQLLRILYVGISGNAKNYGSKFVAAEDYTATEQFWIATQYAITSYTNGSSDAYEYYGKYLGANKSLAEQIKAAANDTSIVVPDGTVAYLYTSSGKQPFVAASFPVVQHTTTYGQATKITMVDPKKTTPPPASGDGKVIIKKVDESGKFLKGAKFQIKDANGNVVKEFTSNGQAQEFILPVGKYTLVEVAAPSGYTKSDEVYEFTIEPGAAGSVNPGKTASVAGFGDTSGSIIMGANHMEVGKTGLAFCVNPQANFLWQDASRYSYKVLTEDQVDLNAFGTKTPAGAHAFVKKIPSNVNLTP